MAESKYFAIDIIRAVDDDDFDTVKLIVKRYKEIMFNEGFGND